MALLRSLLIVVATTFCLGPVVWQAISSVKPESALVRLPPLLPESPTGDHYRSVLVRSSLRRELFNSFVVAASTTGSAIALGAPCAFGLARLPIRGSTVIMGLILSVSMFPPIAAISPVYLLARALGLRDTLVALILIHTAYALPLAIWVLTSFFARSPWSCIGPLGWTAAAPSAP